MINGSLKIQIILDRSDEGIHVWYTQPRGLYNFRCVSIQNTYFSDLTNCERQTKGSMKYG